MNPIWVTIDIYITQAQAKFAIQDYTVGTCDRHGQRFTIVVEVRSQQLITGWILDDQGILKLATPFAGFPQARKPIA